MNLIELITKRRSARRYSDQLVSREVIDRCLEAARLAPSACNSQPWSFVVVDDPGVRDRLAERAFSGIYKMNAFVKTAPVLIVVITERSGYAARLGGLLRSVKYSLVDIGIAGEHLVLQAAVEGLGTCWLGWFNARAVRKVLGLPFNTQIDIVISMGYAESEPGPARPRKSLDELRRFHTE
jgi:nitroreductase